MVQYCARIRFMPTQARIQGPDRALVAQSGLFALDQRWVYVSRVEVIRVIGRSGYKGTGRSAVEYGTRI